jgi:hypoxanthine phosphoribosyltransferase
VTESTDPAIGPIVLDAEAIAERVKALGAEIGRDYAGRKPLLICVLKGAVIFLADLVRALDIDVEVDFMAVSSYGASTRSSGVVRIVKDLDIDISGRDVLVVEDIVDSGLTLNWLRKALRARKPASLEVCALVVREGNQKVDQDLRYVGFAIPPNFVVGYGLDVAETYRNLPFIAVYNGPEPG